MGSIFLGFDELTKLIEKIFFNDWEEKDRVMHGCKHGICLVLLGVMAMAPAGAETRDSYIQALPRSTSPGQVAQAAFPISEILGAQAPASNVGTEPSLDVTALSVVETLLADRIRAKDLTVQQIDYDLPTNVGTFLSTEDKQIISKPLTSTVLTAGMLADAALAIQNRFQSKNRLVAIRFGYVDNTL